MLAFWIQLVWMRIVEFVAVVTGLIDKLVAIDFDTFAQDALADVHVSRLLLWQQFFIRQFRQFQIYILVLKVVSKWSHALRRSRGRWKLLGVIQKVLNYSLLFHSV